LALWNGVDPILKERLFGLTNGEGNHGEDVKEYYFYLDNTPTHSYMKYLYKYPHTAYPYDQLVRVNRHRTRHDREYELLDTGVFDQDRYFDVLVEYAKGAPEDILIKISATNHGPDPARLHLLPTLWFRNTWSWAQNSVRPELLAIPGYRDLTIISAGHPVLGARYLYAEGSGLALFTENETNQERIFGRPNPSPYVKDGFHDYLVHGRTDKVNPAGIGTKAAVLYDLTIDPEETRVVRLRLSHIPPVSIREVCKAADGHPLRQVFDDLVTLRRQEADEFYENISPPGLNSDEKNIMRQALAGMLWTKQYYHFDLDKWMDEHGVDTMSSTGPPEIRNGDWSHMINDDIISMPDKWEFPWYAAWDLAFHSVTLAMVDLDFAKRQIKLVLNDLYLHPDGRIRPVNGTSMTCPHLSTPGPLF
ncbi:MAG: glucosidase, partial [Deltaproteobacteria bacterium]|nr:glucosidase [Deltaproteobacteria bacterium]